MGEFSTERNRQEREKGQKHRDGRKALIGGVMGGLAFGAPGAIAGAAAGYVAPKIGRGVERMWNSRSASKIDQARAKQQPKSKVL
jgi:hypothetical protein